MYKIINFLEWLFRKLALRIQFSILINNFNSQLNGIRIKNKSLFKTGYDNQLKKQYVKKWSVFNHPFSTEPFKVYSSSSGIASADYVPDNIFYWIIEPSINRLRTNFAYADKNFYEKFYTPGFFPKGILHCINNGFYDGNYQLIPSLDRITLENLLSGQGQVVLKPSTDSRGGRNIQIFTRTNGSFVNKANETLSSEYLNRIRNSDFVVQERIAPHPFYDRFNHTSLNTVRIMTYKSVKTGNIEVLCSLLKMGKPGSQVDNLHSGGAIVALSDSGELSDFGICSDGTFVHHLFSEPGTKLSDIGTVYNYDKLVEAAKTVASQVLNFRLISFDMCIDSTGSPRVIELNLGNQGTAFFQACRGPLFGDFTDEILDYCLANKKVRNQILL